jgi:hypothetical protein
MVKAGDLFRPWLLLLRFLRSFLLGGCEALSLFATRRAFPYVVSALAVSHNTFILLLSLLLPSDFANGVNRASHKGNASRN